METVWQRPLEKVLGRATTKKLTRLGVENVSDLLFHFPRRYAYRGQLTSIDDLTPGDYLTVMAKVLAVNVSSMRSRRGYLLTATIGAEDSLSIAELVFFPQSIGMCEYLKRLLKTGSQGIFSGKVTLRNGKLQFSHPQMDLFNDEDSLLSALEDVDAPIPVYPLTQGLSTTSVWKSVQIALTLVDSEPYPEMLPLNYRRSLGLLDLASALQQIHNPRTDAEWQAAQIYFRHREAFILQTTLEKRRLEFRSHPSQIWPQKSVASVLTEFRNRLPFKITKAQNQVSIEIAEDLETPQPMQRLLQGDVGSGKTVVAAQAMLQVVANGGQSVLVAPTEVLAAQHAVTLEQLLKPLGYRVQIVTSALNTSQRRRVLADIMVGNAQVVVGTHALFNEQVQFLNLGLVVVDEQHRFGVTQRQALLERAAQVPHLLIMTATPIPRTVAQSVFGDLDISRLDERPAHRQPVQTTVVPEQRPGWMARVWERVAAEIAAGGRVFVVCARVTEQEESSKASVLATVERLQKIPVLKNISIAHLYGAMKGEIKQAIIEQVRHGQTPLLVSSTVIEVGIDIPEATMMVILNADLFGISQLHQLRGRVGRGDKPGLCLVVTNVEESTLAWQRLQAFAKIDDGFALAEADLQIRSEGDVLGAAQAGRNSSLQVLRIWRDGEIVQQAKQGAAQLLIEDPNLETMPYLKEASAILYEESSDYLGQS